MAKRPIDPIIAYEALTWRVTRAGEIALYLVRMDPSTRRLTAELLDTWLLEEGATPSAEELHSEALRAWSARYGRQLRLF